MMLAAGQCSRSGNNDAADSILAAFLDTAADSIILDAAAGVLDGSKKTAQQGLTDATGLEKAETVRPPQFSPATSATYAAYAAAKAAEIAAADRCELGEGAAVVTQVGTQEEGPAAAVDTAQEQKDAAVEGIDAEEERLICLEAENQLAQVNALQQAATSKLLKFSDEEVNHADAAH